MKPFEHGLHGRTQINADFLKGFSVRFCGIRSIRVQNHGKPRRTIYTPIQSEHLDKQIVDQIERRIEVGDLKVGDQWVIQSEKSS